MKRQYNKPENMRNVMTDYDGDCMIYTICNSRKELISLKAKHERNEKEATQKKEQYLKYLQAQDRKQ